MSRKLRYDPHLYKTSGGTYDVHVTENSLTFSNKLIRPAYITACILCGADSFWLKGPKHVFTAMLKEEGWHRTHKRNWICPECQEK